MPIAFFALGWDLTSSPASRTPAAYFTGSIKLPGRFLHEQRSLFCVAAAPVFVSPGDA